LDKSPVKADPFDKPLVRAAGYIWGTLGLIWVAFLVVMMVMAWIGTASDALDPNMAPPTTYGIDNVNGPDPYWDYDPERSFP
jgi:hypothetical protein